MRVNKTALFVKSPSKFKKGCMSLEIKAVESDKGYFYQTLEAAAGSGVDPKYICFIAFQLLCFFKKIFC